VSVGDSYISGEAGRWPATRTPRSRTSTLSARRRTTTTRPAPASRSPAVCARHGTGGSPRSGTCTPGGLGLLDGEPRMTLG